MSPLAADAPSVAVVGGGLAGLAAGCALAGAGFRVTLLERRPYLGGRASSYEHPGTGEVVDNCQHVLLGCCTNLVDFYRRIGVEEKIRWFDRLTFVEPGGRQSVISPSWLPAPFHSAPSFLRADSLSFADKRAIARGMLAITVTLPKETEENFLAWLRRHGQTERAIERFWKVVLVSALNEDLDRMSVHYAAQVFRESFLKSPEAGRMGIPTVPLTELYSAGADYIRARGGEVALRAPVESFQPEPGQVRLCLAGREVRSDFAVLAVPFDALARLLPDAGDTQPLRQQLARFETSPITGIHLWFDRQITDLEHAVLLDRTIQWMFHKSELVQRADSNQGGSYVELVVSSSKALVEKPKNEIEEMALRELREFFPGAAEAKLIKSTVIKEVHATYSALPRSDDYRPGTATAWPSVFLAGDWTATGWPATMEGAVRSGYQAAEALARSAGRQEKFLLPDLAATGFMRLFRHGSGSRS
ncbi:MAG TPA: hydroxysqualene dehydroxylase HpnE [Terriglobales bacterium]|nr:hydroxysqualene dehydroxylase HpnE [Terriglobales bacterium]